MGYGFTDRRTQAQLVIFNTCAVREHAEDRVFGNVGALKKYKHENPGTVIACCGCMMQQQHIADKIKKAFLLWILFSALMWFTDCPNLFTKRLQEKTRV